MIREPDIERQRVRASRQVVDADKTLERIALAEELINVKMVMLIEERRKLLNEKILIMGILAKRR
jgi:hypothetical protein